MKRRGTSHRLLPLWFFISCMGMAAESDPDLSPLRVNYSPRTVDGTETQSAATAMPGGTVAVTVINPGQAPKSANLQHGNGKIPVDEILRDPVSQLEFLTVDQGHKLQPPPWNTEVGSQATAALRALGAGGPVPCRSTGWVKQVGGKVLPFALLSVEFSGGVPSPGTAVVDDRGAVVGIVFQASGTENTGYVIPAEAILRVRHDFAEGGPLVRGWLGLALHTGVQIPQISRILADSPADKAGIQVGDIIVSVGSRIITDYADAANAFFYAIPGTPVTLVLRRGDERVEVTLTPTKPPADL